MSLAELVMIIIHTDYDLFTLRYKLPVIWEGTGSLFAKDNKKGVFSVICLFALLKGVKDPWFIFYVFWGSAGYTTLLR